MVPYNGLWNRTALTKICPVFGHLHAECPSRHGVNYVLTTTKTDTQFIIQDRDLGERALFIEETGTLSRINPSFPEAPILLNTTPHVHTEKLLPYFNFSYTSFLMWVPFYFTNIRIRLLFSFLLSMNSFSFLFLFNLLLPLLANLIYCTFSLLLLLVLSLRATLFAYFVISPPPLFCQWEKGLLEKARRRTDRLGGGMEEGAVGCSLSKADTSVTLDWFSLVGKAL